MVTGQRVQARLRLLCRAAGRSSTTADVRCAGLLPAVVLLCLSPIMENERFTQALCRIEAAIDRIEQAAQAPAPDARLAALEERHRRLRDGTGEALARLDRLIDLAANPTTEA